MRRSRTSRRSSAPADLSISPPVFGAGADAVTVQISILACRLEVAADAQVLGGSERRDSVHFPQQAGVHVENKSSDSDILCYPRMCSYLLDLFPSVLLRITIREEPHGSRRRVASRRTQSGVQLIVCERRKPTAGVIEKQYLCGPEYPIRHDELCENVFCYGWSASPDNVDIGHRQTEDSRQV